MNTQLLSVAFTFALGATQAVAASEIASAPSAPYGSYTWGVIGTGQPVYSDRSFTFTSVPPSLQGADYLVTANSDRKSGSSLQFEVGQPVTLYVAYDLAEQDKPSWLLGWSMTGERLLTSNATLGLFSKQFEAGTVVIGGNAASKGNSMYSVVIVPVVEEPAPAPEPEVPVDGEAPGQPGPLSVESLTASSVTVTFPAASDNVGVAGYVVFRDGSELQVIDTTSFTDSGLSSDSDFTYSVIAYDAAGNLSVASAPLTVHTLVAEQAPPEPVVTDAFPVAQSDSAILTENTATRITVLANDSGLEDGILSVTLSSAPAHGSAVIGSDYVITYTPDADYVGNDSLMYQITDTDGDIAFGSVSIQIDSASYSCQYVAQ